MGLPTAVVVAALVGFFQLFSGIGIFIVYQTSSATQNEALFQLLAKEKENNMHDAAEAVVKTLRDATYSVEYFDPSMQDCLPSAGTLSNKSGEALLRTLGSLPDPGAVDDATTWLSIGTMQRAPTTGKKWSWQIALGFGCSDYIYAYIDGSIAPQFHGYCASLNRGERGYRLDTSRLAYNGTDWGFKPDEEAMLDGKFNESVLPITSLLGVFTCTYERLVYCSADDRKRHHTAEKPFALVFAERSLHELDAALAALRNNDEGVSFIVERTSGLLIAASVANQTQNAKGERVAASNARDATIVKAMALVVAAKNATVAADFNGELLVSVERFAPVRGVDWLLVVAVPTDLLVGSVRNANKKSIAIFVAVLVISVVAAVASTYFLVTRPLRRLREFYTSKSSMPYGRPSVLSEVADVEQLLLAGAPAK